MGQNDTNGLYLHHYWSKHRPYTFYEFYQTIRAIAVLEQFGSRVLGLLRVFGTTKVHPNLCHLARYLLGTYLPFWTSFSHSKAGIGLG